MLQTPEGKLAYLDFGMMAEVSAKRRYALIGAALGLVNKDIDLVIRNLRDLEFLPSDSDTDKIVTALNDALANSTENGQGSTLNFTRFNQVLQFHLHFAQQIIIAFIHRTCKAYPLNCHFVYLPSTPLLFEHSRF